MGKIIQQTINKFDLGITNDPRNPNSRYCQMVKNFDIHTYQGKLVPLRSTEVGDSNATSLIHVRNFCVAKLATGVPSLGTVTEYALYGLAKLAASARVQVYYKHIAVADTATDFDDAAWTATAAASSSTGTTGEFDLFVYYEKTGLIYGSRDLTKIWAYDPAPTVSGGHTQSPWDDDIITTNGGTPFSYTTIRQGIVHSKDDILYIPYDNIIAKNNNGSWNTTAITLPKHLQINSICEYNNYLAIACAPKSGFGKSVVYLWDRDSSLATLSESIDWGDGEIFALEEIDGASIGISNVGKGGSTAHALGATTNQRIVFRYLSGNKAIVFNQLVSAETTSTLTTIFKKYKANNYIYFPLFMTFPDGTLREGIWKIGKDQAGSYAISLDRTPVNDTLSTSMSTFTGFIVIGDFVFMSYNDGTTVVVRKTLAKGASGEYSQTSQYDTVVLNGGDSSITKKLVGVTIFTEPLPSGASIVLKYKIDAETSFTTIFTNTTASSLSHSAVNIESSGVALPDFKEITFSLQSTGGGVITGLKYKYEILDKDIY